MSSTQAHALIEYLLQLPVQSRRTAFQANRHKVRCAHIAHSESVKA